MAKPASDTTNGETPTTGPWPEKTIADKATATEDLAKEEEEALKEEDALMMPPPSPVIPEAEAQLPAQPPEEPPQSTLEEEGKEEKETAAPQVTPEEETKLPPTPEKELVVLQPSVEELTVFRLPLENVSQSQPLKEPTVLQPLPVKEPSLLRVPPKEEPEAMCRPPEKDQPDPLPLKQLPSPQPPPLKEPAHSQPALVKEPVVPLLPPFEEPLAPPIKVPFVPQPPLKQAWPTKEVSAASVVAHAKPKAVSPVQRRRETAVNDTLEEIAFPLGQTGHSSQSAMANSIDSFIKSSVGQVFATTIDRALEKSEEWLDYYFPVIETEDDYCKAAEEKCAEPSEDLCKEGCFMKIGSLSSKVRDRAFKLALHHLKTMRQNTNENLSLLDHILHMLEHPHSLSLPNVSEQLQNIWTEWKLKQGTPSTKRSLRTSSITIMPEQLELKALELTKTLAQQLYSTYQNLLPHVADLPTHLQDKVIRVYEGMEEIQSRFSSAALKDLPASFAVQSRQKMASARETLDELLDFVVSNPQGLWPSQLTSLNAGKSLASLATERQIKKIDAEGKGESSRSQQPALPPPQP